MDVSRRVSDLLSRMTLPEKAGLLFHTMIAMGPGGRLAGPDLGYGLLSAKDMVLRRTMNHFNLITGAASPAEMAEWHNRLQDLAAGTRLGIPVTLSTDPRHAYSANPNTQVLAGPFSVWPEPLGLAATRDPALVARCADIIRQEYLAVGLRVALHPQVDLATEPRWARVGRYLRRGSGTDEHARPRVHPRSARPEPVPGQCGGDDEALSRRWAAARR